MSEHLSGLIRKHEQRKQAIRTIEGKISGARHQIRQWEGLLEVDRRLLGQARQDLLDYQKTTAHHVDDPCGDRCAHTGLLCKLPKGHDGKHLSIWHDGSIQRYTEVDQ